eukprot:362836-Chlamydomonas_euryale.AAC.4
MDGALFCAPVGAPQAPHHEQVACIRTLALMGLAGLAGILGRLRSWGGCVSSMATVGVNRHGAGPAALRLERKQACRRRAGRASASMCGSPARLPLPLLPFPPSPFPPRPFAYRIDPPPFLFPLSRPFMHRAAPAACFPRVKPEVELPGQASKSGFQLKLPSLPRARTTSPPPLRRAQVKPEAQSYYRLGAAQLRITFPDPAPLEGVTSREKSILKMIKVGFTYPGATKKALEGVTLHCRLSSRVAVVGANGAGKTTLIKILCAELKPQVGPRRRLPASPFSLLRARPASYPPSAHPGQDPALSCLSPCSAPARSPCCQLTHPGQDSARACLALLPTPGSASLPSTFHTSWSRSCPCLPCPPPYPWLGLPPVNLPHILVKILPLPASPSSLPPARSPSRQPSTHPGQDPAPAYLALLPTPGSVSLPSTFHTSWLRSCP